MTDLISSEIGPNDLYVSKVSATYVQADGEDIMTLEYEDLGAGPYFTIKTEKGWSFNSKEELINIIDDFSKRVSV